MCSCVYALIGINVGGRNRPETNGAPMRNIAGFSASILAAVVAVALVASCSRSKPDAAELPAGSVTLVGAGSSFDAVLFNRWFTVYHDSHPRVFLSSTPQWVAAKAFAVLSERTLRRKTRLTSGPAIPPCPTWSSHKRTTTL